MRAGGTLREGMAISGAPASLRSQRGLVLLLLVCLAASITFAIGRGAGAEGSAGDNAEGRFLSLLNQERQGAGLAPLTPHPGLQEVARTWSAHMAGKGDLSHNPDLLDALQASAGSGVKRVAENVGYGGSAVSIHEALVASPGHHKNMLGDYELVGIGVVVVEDVTWVTFDFAGLGPVGAPAAPPPTTSLPTTAPAPLTESAPPDSPVTPDSPVPEPSASTSTSTLPTPTSLPPEEPARPESPSPLAPAPAPLAAAEADLGAAPSASTIPPTPVPPAAPPPIRAADDTEVPPAGASLPAHLQALTNSVRRSSASNTDALITALRPLADGGLSDTEVASVGYGRFPVAGRASYVHDWWFPRFGPSWRLHEGTDIFAAMGSAVRSPSAGTVRITNGGLGGLSLHVTQPDGTYYYLAHLSGIAPGLVDGAGVRQGEVIGAVGDSGNARGGLPHLHFEFHPGGGRAVDPKPILDQFLHQALDAAPAVVQGFAADAPPAPLVIETDSSSDAQQIDVPLSRPPSTEPAPAPSGLRDPEMISAWRRSSPDAVSSTSDLLPFETVVVGWMVAMLVVGWLWVSSWKDGHET